MKSGDLTMNVSASAFKLVSKAKYWRKRHMRLIKMQVSMKAGLTHTHGVLLRKNFPSGWAQLCSSEMSSLIANGAIMSLIPLFGREKVYTWKHMNSVILQIHFSVEGQPKSH